MARASVTLCIALLTLLLSFRASTSSADPPASPSPEADAPGSPIQPPPSPSPSPSDFSSPPAPPPEFLPYPGPSPAFPPSDGDDDSSPSPVPSGPDAYPPAPVADESSGMKKDVKVKPASEMSGGKKAGITVGVFAFAGLAALGGVVYKKRKENIERAMYGADARRDLL